MRFPEDFFKPRTSPKVITEERHTEEADDLPEEPIDTLPPTALDADGRLPAHSLLRTKEYTVCEYLRPEGKPAPIIRDADGCEVYIIKERCKRCYEIYLVMGPDEFLLFRGSTSEQDKYKRIRICPDGSTHDFGEAIAFPPLPPPMKDGEDYIWAPPDELVGGAENAHSETSQDENHEIHVEYILVLQPPVIIEGCHVFATYRLATRTTKTNLSDGSLVEGFPRIDIIEHHAPVTREWTIPECRDS
jgi:hypothetical protein